MELMHNFNQALLYIEDHLDSEVDYQEISRITLCPVSVFQRFFALATGISLKEYIRRRKLTCAAQELRDSDIKVIDAAIKYGYESSDAFCVAFKRLYRITPTAARNPLIRLKYYYRLYFTLSVTHIKGDEEMKTLLVGKYNVKEPMFEGVRAILAYMGEPYTPEYIQGISGAAFKIAGGCPSRPTCVYTRWPTEFIKYLGYEIFEYPCVDQDGNSINESMINAVRNHIDAGRPALVWHAFTNAEWDVVCGYDEEQEQFIGRGSYAGLDDYERASWLRPSTSDIYPFGAVVIGERKNKLNERQAEIESLKEAVKHARTVNPPDNGGVMEGIEFYKFWADDYANGTREREVADAYCHDIYSASRRTAAVYLNEIAPNFNEKAAEKLREAGEWFNKESSELDKASPYLSWGSPWGYDSDRSKAVAPIISDAAIYYENAIVCIEEALAEIE